MRALLIVDCRTPAMAANLPTPPAILIARSHAFIDPSITYRDSNVNTHRVRRKLVRVNNQGMGFKQNLRKYRKAAQMTQEQLAHACGFPGQSRIANYENGAREASYEDLEKLAQVLKVSQTELLGGEVPAAVHSENDVTALHIVTQALVKALAENIRGAGPDFVRFAREGAKARNNFSTDKGFLAIVLGIAEQAQHTAE